jgi:hypothetical protein
VPTFAREMAGMAVALAAELIGSPVRNTFCALAAQPTGLLHKASDEICVFRIPR